MGSQEGLWSWELAGSCRVHRGRERWEVPGEGQPWGLGGARSLAAVRDGVSRRYRAMYQYRPQNDDELELREGDRVDVMQQCDDGWFVGVSRRTQKFGTFPGNYVAPV